MFKAVLYMIVFWALVFGLLFLGLLNFLLVTGILFLVIGSYFDRNASNYFYSYPNFRPFQRRKSPQDSLEQREIKSRHKGYARVFLALGIYALATWFIYGIWGEGLEIGG